MAESRNVLQLTELVKLPVSSVDLDVLRRVQSIRVVRSKAFCKSYGFQREREIQIRLTCRYGLREIACQESGDLMVKQSNLLGKLALGTVITFTTVATAGRRKPPLNANYARRVRMMSV